MVQRKFQRTLLLGVIAILAGFLCLVSKDSTEGAPLPASPSPSEKIDFSRDIQPIFERSCYGCHGEKQQMAGLRLDSKKLAFAGGQSGKAIVPGKATESHLYQRVAGIGDQARMPMGGQPLAATEIRLIRDWIDQGADWPDGVGSETGEVK